MKENIKLLIIDDFQLSALGTKAILTDCSPGCEIFTAFSVDEAIDVLENHYIDIVLCDIVMPEKDGFDALRIIKNDFPNTKLIFLSISDDKETVYKALAYGADGYQFKDVTKDVLIDSIKTVIKGNKYFHQRVINVLYDDLHEFAILKLDDSSSSANKLSYFTSQDINSIGSKNLTKIEELLTDREIEIMEMIANNSSTKEIADKLKISIFTVSTHRKNIYAKLGLENLTQMRKLARDLMMKNVG
ncbi:response regulator transcription factor [Candidatus Kapaibacterium sp.]